MIFDKISNEYFRVMLFLLFTIIIGCEGPQGEIGPAGPKGDPGPTAASLTGDIAGRIILYKDGGLPIEDKSGVTISIEGTSSSTISNYDGTWKFSNIPAGVFSLVFSKQGFTTHKKYNIQFVGGGVFYVGGAYLSQLPIINVTELKLSLSDSSTYIVVQGKVSSPDTVGRFVGVFFSKSFIKISSTIPFLFARSFWVIPNSTTFNSVIYQTTDYDFIYHGISSGTKLYASAFTLPYNGIPSGLNLATNTNEIYNSGISFSNIDSVVVP